MHPSKVSQLQQQPSKMAVLTTLGIISLESSSYPQTHANAQSYSHLVSTSGAGLRTAFNSIQVLDKKGENEAVHREARPLSTTTNLN